MYINNNKAILILHEIYGVNQFITDTCQKFKTAGFDVFCPDLIHRPSYNYEQTDEAYQNFMANVGFNSYKKIIEEVKQLKTNYEKVYILGFSVGATLAWRCCELPFCDGIIACYGSRIRDYADLTPACPTLLLFANEPSFDVSSLILSLQGKPHLEIHAFHADHGFLDPYEKSFDMCCSNTASSLISDFLTHQL